MTTRKIAAARAFHGQGANPTAAEVEETMAEIDYFRQPGNTLRPGQPRRPRGTVEAVGPLVRSGDRRAATLHFLDEDDPSRTLCGRPTVNFSTEGYGTATCAQCARVGSRLHWSPKCRRFGRRMPGCQCPPYVRH